MESNFINCDIIDDIAVLELDDPSANTLTYHLLCELEDRFLCLEGNPKIKGVVLTGKGEKFFSGGVNIGMLLTAGEKHNSHFILHAAEVLDYIHSSEKFIVAGINGNITGGGLELALISDHRLAVEGEYNIGFPEVRLGVIPGMGGTQRLSHLVGPQVALEMITQGEFVSPEKAKAIGLIDQIISRDNFKKSCVEFAQALSKTITDEHYSGYENYTEVAEQSLLQDLVNTNSDGAIATLSLTEKTLSSHPLSVLIALNHAILECRSDEDIHAIIIDMSTGGIRIQSPEEGLAEKSVCPLLLRYARQVFSRIDGFPRLVTLVSSRILNAIEFELATFCDYRVMSANSEIACLVQDLPSNLVNQQRFSTQINFSEKTECSIEELQACGFYMLARSNNTLAWTLDWMFRFVPPMGAGQAIGYAKLAITRGSNGSIDQGLMLERHLQEQLFAGKDAKEGMSAYVEKRTPQFVGD